MKKIIAVLLAILMIVSLSACGKTPTEDDVRGEQTENESAPQNSEVEFSLGTVEGPVYENRFIGLGFRLKEGWTFYSDEQIKELNNLAAEVAGEDYVELLKDSALVYDMYATSSDQMSNVNVNLEKVNALQLAAINLATNFENSFPTLEQSFSNMGYTNISHEVGTITIDNKEFTSLSVTGEINGVKMYQKHIAVKCYGYLANIAVTTFNEDTTDDIYADFYVVK